MEIMQRELNELTTSKGTIAGDSFTQLLSKEDSNLDTSIIMYAEQLARKDVEINTLRAKVLLLTVKTIINVLKSEKSWKNESAQSKRNSPNPRPIR